MSETNPPTDPTSTNPPTPAPKKKRRKWPWVILGLLLIVPLLVLLAPAIISTGAVKGIVVSQVNKNLNGRVEIADWSIGWTSGVKVDGVQVFDASNTPILEVKTFSTQLSLLDAAKQKFNLGKTILDGVKFKAKVDDKGQLNFATLPKSQPTAPKTEETKPAEPKTTEPRTVEAKAKEPGKLPEVSGDIVLSNISGTFEQPGQPVLEVTSLSGGATIKSLNDPIDHNLDVALKVQDKDAGKITLKGTASAKDQDVKNLNVNDTVTLASIDTAALKPLIPASAGIDANSGITNGTLQLIVADGKTATLSGDITGSNYDISGKALKGDHFAPKQLKIILPVVVAMPNGPTDTAAMTIKTGGDKPQPISLTWDQGSVTVAVDAALQALMNLGANKAPGSNGSVNIGANVDLAKLAKALPNTLSIPKEVDLKTGSLSEKVDLKLVPEQASFSVVTDIKDITGTNDNKPVNIQPINVSLTGNARGSDAKLPDLRDLKLGLTSGFATANFNAPTLTQLTGQASADLKKLQDELGQIVDFQGKTLQGQFVMNVAAKGDPQKLSTPAPAHTDITLSGVHVTGVGDQPINVEKLVTNIDAVLHATDDGALQSVDQTTVAVANYKGQDKTIDALINQIAVKLGDTMTASWNVEKLTADLAKLQDDLRPFVPALKGKTLDLGTLTAKLSGDLTQTKDTLTANIKGLDVSESKGLFSLKSGDKPLAVKMVTPADKTATGTLDASGNLGVHADLVRAQALAKQFQTEVTTNGKQPSVKTGVLDGTLDLATVDAKNLTVKGDFKADNLSIDTGHGQTASQTITLKLASTAATDFTSIRDTMLDIGGPFGQVKLDKVAVDLPPAPADGKAAPLPVIKGADLLVNIADFGPIDSLQSAFAPAPPPPATQPVRIPRGAMKLAANIKQDGNTINVNVTELTGAQDDNFRLQQGDGIYKVKPFNGQLAIAIQMSGNTAQPMAEQIQKIDVNTLDLKLGVADISMPEKISIAKPLSDTPAANGAIKIAGKIQDLTAIPEALAKKNKGELYPYEGDFVVQQKVATAGKSIKPTGTIEVNNFAAKPAGGTPFSEPKITIANDLDVNLTDKILKITNLNIAMPQSGALNVTVTGGVTDWESKRQLDNILVKLGGDWEKLWTIVHPMMPKDKDGNDQYKDLTLAGKFDRQIKVSGSMPADKTGPEQTKNLKASGSIGIDKLTWPSKGVDEATNVGTAFVMDGNFVRTSVPDEKAYKPIGVNGGTVEIRDLEIDLTDPKTPRLNMPDEYQMVKGVGLNSILMAQVGKSIPLFSQARDGSGIADVRVNKCKRLPLSDIMTKPVKENDGDLIATYTVQKVKIVNPTVDVILKAIKSKEFGDSLQGSITNARIVMHNGVVEQDTALAIGENQARTLRFTGGVGLEKLDLRNFLVNLSPTLIDQLGFGKDLMKYFPSGLDLPLRGLATHPDLDYTVVPKAIAEAQAKAAADRLLGGNKGGSTTQPGDKKDDPIGGLEDLFGKKKKKK